ncbi:MAG: FRG domain-containing protein [Clostridia bacterium]|nr:FRG domain-containing protein [Clostridia bacterium]
MSYKTISYDSWDEFKRDYCRDLFNKNNFEPDVFIFRGQGSSDWDLISSFDRNYSILNYENRKTAEEELITLFENNCKRNILGTKISDMSAIEKRSIAQHYGVPTRLLDWSSSPFVAAYFAFSTCVATDGKVAIWALKKNHRVFNEYPGLTIQEQLVGENEHQKKQLGCFTLLDSPARSVNNFVELCENHCSIEDALYKLTLPATDFRIALYELEAMNINASTIYGGYEGCAKAARDMVSFKYLYTE